MRWMLVALGLFSLAGGGVIGVHYGPGRARAAGTEAVLGTISDVVIGTGRVVPVTEVMVANKLPGRVKAVLVDEGSAVRVGQPIVEFDDEEYVTQVRQAQARLATAQAEVRLARRSLDAARARWADTRSGARPQEIERARADRHEAQERWKNTEVERTRLKRLFDEGLIARSQYDAAATEAEVARARLRAADETLSLVLAGPRPETVQAMWAQVQEAEAVVRRVESQVAQARADIDHARAVLSTTVLRSTLDGKMTHKFVEAGEATDIGMPLVILADVTRTLVKGEMDETDAGKLRLGQRAEITSDAYPGRIFPATVIEIGQSVGKRTMRPEDPVKIQDMKVLETKLEIADGGAELKLGMTVDVRIIAIQKQEVVVIPRHLVPLGATDVAGQVLTASGSERRRVLLGARDRERVEVLEGIRPGERLVGSLSAVR